MKQKIQKPQYKLVGAQFLHVACQAGAIRSSVPVNYATGKKKWQV